MNIISCYQRNSRWYKEASRGSRPIGVLWHDTGAGNPSVSRYVQPFETDADFDEKIKLLGKNQYGNDWNHVIVKKGVNAFIGKIADGSIATVVTGDFDIHPWGCGGGENGSCNGYSLRKGKAVWGNEHWIQFEICDDGYTDKEYFQNVYKEAVEFTAYICEKYGIDPCGNVGFNGVTVPTILCHQDSYKLGLGNDHGDVLDWFKVFGKTMNDVRNDVSLIIENNKNKKESITEETVEIGIVEKDEKESESVEIIRKEEEEKKEEEKREEKEEEEEKKEDENCEIVESEDVSREKTSKYVNIFYLIIKSILCAIKRFF